MAGARRRRLGAEIGRALGDDSGVTVLPPSLLAEGATFSDHRRPRRRHPCAVRAAGAIADHFDAASGYGLFDAGRKLTAAAAEMGVAPRAVPADPQCPARRGGRSGQSRARGVVGFGPHAGTGASRNLGRHRRCRRIGARGAGRAVCGRRGLTPTTAKTRSFTAPVLAVSHGCKAVTCRRRPRRSSTKTAAIWSSGRPATSDRT